MKILVLWARAFGNANLGVSVLAQGAASVARQAWGSDCEFEFQEFSSVDGSPAFTRKAFLSDALRFGHGPVRRRLEEFDVVLDTGAGDSFTDHYGISRLAQIVYAQAACQRARVPMHMMPQTIGPFSTAVGRRLGRVGIASAAQVFTRDTVSRDAAIKLGAPDARKFTDVVFALPQPEKPDSSHDVLFNVSGLLWNENRHVDAERYRSTVRSLTNELVARGRRVTFLAHVVGSEHGAGDNDVPPVLALAREFGGKVGHLVPQGLEQVREAAAGSRLVIGSRMHACLNALSVGTAAIPLAYSRKFAPLLSDLGWGHGLDLRDDGALVELALESIDRGESGEFAVDLATLQSNAAAQTRGLVQAMRRYGDA